MTSIIRVWPTDAFDAIDLSGPRCQIAIVGTDEDQVSLEGEVGALYPNNGSLEPAERWLQLHLWFERSNDAELTLRLPRKKAWVVEVSAGWGKVDVSDVQARMQVMLGKGDVHIEDSQGVFSIGCGDGNVRMERTSEAAMPERPPLPHIDTPEFPPPPINPGKMQAEGAWGWFFLDPEEWAEWGMQIGDQARMWATNFGQWFDRVGWNPQRSGISLHLQRGDANLQDIEASVCTVRLRKGNIYVERGLVANLNLSTSHGDIYCAAVMPTDDWALRTSHGNLYLTLPSDAQARLDAATRQGDIRSEIPLVRVARPGPESSHGRRMVGTLGRGEGKLPVISLATIHGDIRIDTRSAGYAGNRYAARKQAQSSAAYAAPATPAAAETESDEEPVEGPAEQVIYAPPPASSSIPQEEAPASATGESAAADNPRMAVLQALSQGSISVQEAEQLLRSLESPG